MGRCEENAEILASLTWKMLAEYPDT